jgi:hypothetical protein
MPYTRNKVASNKSCFLLKIQIQNTQTLQQFTMNIKTESIYKKNIRKGLGEET